MASLIQEIHEEQTEPALYVDDEFYVEDGDTDLIFLPHDDVSEEEAQVMRGLKWLRPKEISSKLDLVGFTELGKKITNSREVSNMNEEDFADFRRISYGEILSNRWLLNAVSLIAEEERLLSKITLAHDEDIVNARKYGIYVFRFYKYYQPYYVIIDDKLPCL